MRSFMKTRSTSSADAFFAQGRLSTSVAAATSAQDDNSADETRVILLSAQGRLFTQAVARELATLERVVLVCGRYEGVDERVNELYCDMELSIGDYVLSGGELPAAANLPATCAGGAGSFPCSEHDIWKNGFSFPNLRNGTYRSWSVLRLIATGTAGTNAAALITAAEKAAVLVTPDFVPITAQTITAAENPLFGYAITDKGLLLLRSHYQQYDGSGVDIGVAAVNEPTTSEKGGDMGGLVIPTSIGVTLSASAASNTENQKQIVQSSNPTTGGLGPAIRAVVP